MQKGAFNIRPLTHPSDEQCELADLGLAEGIRNVSMVAGALLAKRLANGSDPFANSNVTALKL
jgi:hypothetical protein